MNPLRATITFVRLVLLSMVLAASQIWANKMRSALTTIGIIIGVASVTTVIALLSGLKAKILTDFESIGTNKVMIFPQWPKEGRMRRASWRYIRFKPEDFDDLLLHCPSLDQFTRLAYMSDNVRVGEYSVEGATVLGIEPSWHAIEGRDIEFGRTFSVVDNNQARNVCLVTPHVRDQLRLDRDCIGQVIMIRNRAFYIVGVVEPAQELFLQMGSEPPKEIYIPFGTAWQLWEPAMQVVATSKSSELSSDARAEVRFYTRQARRLEPTDPDTFMVVVMEDMIKVFDGIARAVTGVAAGVVGISLLVGGVGIMNIMLVSVSERTREIGLRKAVGAKPSALLLQFLVEAVMLCLLGGFLGVVLAQLATLGMAMVARDYLDQAYIPLPAIALAFGFSVSVGVIFGMFPAIKAANLDPIEALRHE